VSSQDPEDYTGVGTSRVSLAGQVKGQGRIGLREAHWSSKLEVSSSLLVEHRLLKFQLKGVMAFLLEYS